MAEILPFSEGTAQIDVGGGFVTQVFVRNVSVQPQRVTYRYRPPYSTTHTHIDGQSRPAALTLTVAESPHATGLRSALYGATPGTVHFHVFAKTPGPNTSAGIYVYSGTLEGGDLAGAAGGDEQTFGVNGWFETWTAY